MQMSPQLVLENSKLLYDEATIQQAIDQMALQIAESIGDKEPLILCVMGGAVVFAGHLLARLSFPLEFDYVQASRYRNQTVGGHDILWKVAPPDSVKGRVVLLLDDILDEGHTLAEVKARCLGMGASSVLSAVLVEKKLGHEKPVKADFIGLQVPNQYVFGFGMDVYGWWRNLPCIRVLETH